MLEKMSQQCRLCAEFKQTAELLNNEINEPLDKVIKLFELDFRNEFLPRKICTSCSKKVEITYHFSEQVRKAQDQIQTIQNDVKLKVEEEHDIFANCASSDCEDAGMSKIHIGIKN